MTQLIPASWKHTLETLRAEMHHLCDRWLPRRAHAVAPAEPPWASSLVLAGGPCVDVEETEDDVIVTAELPGLEKEDFTVSLSGDRLTIHGEKKTSTEETGRHYYYAERRYGAFTRTLTVPCEVDADHARATYKNGVLRLTLPKTAQAKARRVAVTIRD